MRVSYTRSRAKVFFLGGGKLKCHHQKGLAYRLAAFHRGEWQLLWEDAMRDAASERATQHEPRGEECEKEKVKRAIALGATFP